MRANQEFNWVLKDVSIVSGIPRSANNLKKNGDIKGINDQSTIEIEGSFILEEGYINGISDLDTSILAAFSIFTLSNSSILKRP